MGVFKVFIGWSSPHSQRLASAVEKALLLSFEGIQPFIACPEETHGGDWLRRLQNAAHESRAAIFLLGPESQNSWWVPFELGVWSEKLRQNQHNDEELLTFPFRLSKLPRRVELALPETVNLLNLTAEIFLGLIKRLARASTIKAQFSLELDDPFFVEKIWKPIQTLIDDGHHQLLELTAFEAAKTELNEIVSREAGGASVLVGWMNGIKDLIAADKGSSDLSSALLLLLNRSAYCAKELFDPSEDPWQEQEATQVVEVIKRAALALKEISNGELVVFREDNLKSFYKNNVIGRVRKSMWTTNFSDYNGSFGRTAEADVLRAHKSARERGANLQRVFAVDGNLDRNNMSRFVQVITAQIAVGVAPFLINSGYMNEIINENRHAIRLFKSPDIMILDSNRVYVTQLDHCNKVTGIRLLRGDEILAAAQNVRASIMDEAVAVDVTCIEDQIAYAAT